MQWAQKHKGFTIVELLIVIVVIAILAAITIVAFNGVQQRSRESAAQTKLSSINKKLELYKLDNNDRYPTATQLSLWRNLLTESAGDVTNAAVQNFVLCLSNSGDRYAVIAWAPISPQSGGSMYYVSSTTTSVSRVTYGGQGSYPSVSASACALVLTSDVTTWSHNL